MFWSNQTDGEVEVINDTLVIVWINKEDAMILQGKQKHVERYQSGRTVCIIVLLFYTWNVYSLAYRASSLSMCETII